MEIGKKYFDFDRSVYVMGILNITPDSFSDGGRKDWNNLEKILKHVDEMISEGADIIDVGGQTTQVGYKEIDAEIEKKRIVPVIKEIKRCFDIVISVDTYRAEVADQAINAGADMVNDIWGLKKSPELAHIVANSGVAYCLANYFDIENKNNFLKNVKYDLCKQLDKAIKAGISSDKIIIDPGISLGKNYEENMCLLNNLEYFKALGFPMLLGVSRKNFMNKVLQSKPSERVEMTIAANAIGIIKGCSIVRVHDIKQNKRAVAIANAIREAKL